MYLFIYLFIIPVFIVCMYLAISQNKVESISFL